MIQARRIQESVLEVEKWKESSEAW